MTVGPPVEIATGRNSTRRRAIRDRLFSTQRVLRFWQNGITLLLMKTLTIKVSDEMFAEIAGMAQARKVSKSEIARERLAQKPVGDPAKKASLWSRMEDLVIDSESLPTDLSSNKAYIEGYGKKRAH